jgi:pescadillo protein
MVAERYKRGSQGAASAYVTRAKALRMLQLSLSDFRRLCILKGIFPRYPKNKFEGSNKTYYLKKDIQFLAHEPLIGKFREFSAHLRRYRSALARADHAQAKFLARSRPTYSLEHLVRERYPSFRDALEELDDALTLVHLFAELPPMGERRRGIGRTLFKSARLDNCVRLRREWQFFLTMRPGCLRRVFASVRGFYFEAEIEGVRILWSQPHRFVQYVPNSVDLKVMSTFLEFYETLLHFVFLRLYQQILGLQYPPDVDRMEESRGALVRQIIQTRAYAATDEDCQPDSTKSSSSKERSQATALSAEASGVPSSQQVAKTIAASDNLVANDIDEEGLDTSGATDVQAASSTAPSSASFLGKQFNEGSDKASRANLFHGLYFYLCRETPVHVLEMALYACGAELVGYENPCADVSPLAVNDARITHVVADRPLGQLPERLLDREYVQPQWIFDSINEVFRLPTWLYRVGRRLPPHLSPWESELEAENQQQSEQSNSTDTAGTRRPAYRLYLDRLKRGEPSMPLPEELAWLDEIASSKEHTNTSHSETNLQDSHPAVSLEPEESDHEAGMEIDDDTDHLPSSEKLPRSSADRKQDEKRARQRMLLSRRKQRLYDRLVMRQEAEQRDTAPALIKRPRGQP